MLSSEDIKNASLDVQYYWGSHMYVRVVPDGGACMDWREVHLPEDCYSWTSDQLISTLLHEWGHRMISPISPQRGAIWRKIAEKQGLNKAQAGFIVNFATDTWIDRTYLEDPDWQEVYLSGLASDLKDLKQRRKEQKNREIGKTDLIPWLLHGFYHQLFDDISRDKKNSSRAQLEAELSDKIQAELFKEFKRCLDDCWKVLYQGVSTNEARIDGLAQALKEWIPETPPKGTSIIHAFSGREKNSGGWTTRLRAEARRAGLSSRQVEEISTPEELEKYREQSKRLKMYAQVVPVLQQFFSKRPHMSFAGYKNWQVGRPLQELDMLATLQRSGQMVPSVNTLSRNYEKRGTQHGPGRGCVVIIIDDSGSTDGNVLQREKEAAFAIIAAARMFGDPVGCIVFGSEITFSIEPSTHYVQIEDTICSLSSDSGGTCIAPAMNAAFRMIASMGGGSIMIMTDAELGDLREIQRSFYAFPNFTQMTAFCFNDEKSIRENFGTFINQRFRVLSAAPDRPFAETALEEIYG